MVVASQSGCQNKRRYFFGGKSHTLSSRYRCSSASRESSLSAIYLSKSNYSNIQPKTITLRYCAPHAAYYPRVYVVLCCVLLWVIDEEGIKRERRLLHSFETEQILVFQLKWREKVDGSPHFLQCCVLPLLCAPFEGNDKRQRNSK